LLSLGIDIGGTSIKAALLASGGEVVASSRSDVYSRPDIQWLRAAVTQVVGAVTGCGAPDAIGLCVPGAVDERSGRVVKSINVPGLVGLMPSEVLPLALSGVSRIRQYTDAFAAGADIYLSEQLMGRLLAVSLGTGVGAAVIDDGCEQLILHGRSSGHFGQMDVGVEEAGQETPIGPDGGRGGLEAYLGLPALLARYGCESDPRLLMKRIKPDDAPVRALARALRIAHAIYKPEHVYLLGGLSLVLAPYLQHLRVLIEDGLTGVAMPSWTLRTGESDLHAARGAAKLALSF